MMTSSEDEEPMFRFVTCEGAKTAETAKTVQDAQNKRDKGSHIRKSILRNYKTRAIEENLRFYVPPPPSPPISDSLNSIIPRQTKTHAKKYNKKRTQSLDGSRHVPNPRAWPPFESHPFTAYICRYVPLPAGRIDGLLKSGQYHTTQVPPNIT
jgi:hypothetical protein